MFQNKAAPNLDLNLTIWALGIAIANDRWARRSPWSRDKLLTMKLKPLRWHTNESQQQVTPEENFDSCIVFLTVTVWTEPGQTTIETSRLTGVRYTDSPLLLSVRLLRGCLLQSGVWVTLIIRGIFGFYSAAMQRMRSSLCLTGRHKKMRRGQGRFAKCNPYHPVTEAALPSGPGPNILMLIMMSDYAVIWCNFGLHQINKRGINWIL